MVEGLSRHCDRARVIGSHRNKILFRPSRLPRSCSLIALFPDKSYRPKFLQFCLPALKPMDLYGKIQSDKFESVKEGSYNDYIQIGSGKRRNIEII